MKGTVNTARAAMLARRFIRAALRSSDETIRRRAREACHHARTRDHETGRLRPHFRPDDTYTLKNDDAIDLAAHVADRIS